MLADGSIVTASREQEPELFGLAMGGYGLTSAILSLDVEMVPNALLKPVFTRMPATEIASRFMATVADGVTTMAYGRLDVTKRTFFQDALLIAYAARSRQRRRTHPGGRHRRLGSALSRDIYRAQVGSEIGKRARWLAETRVGPSMNAGAASRNALMNEPVSNLAANDPRYRDILHEYFIPPGRYGDFLTLCQKLIPESGQELLNITLRYVAADPVSRLAFAPTPAHRQCHELCPAPGAGLGSQHAEADGSADRGRGRDRRQLLPALPPARPPRPSPPHLHRRRGFC